MPESAAGVKPPKLPLSSYQGLHDQQLGTKRQKIMKSVTRTSQADMFRSELKTEYPSFTKRLMKSHVSKNFKLGIPELFCMEHLTISGTSILLENESGKIYKASYSSKAKALWWREFCLAEKLSEGDVLVFWLVSPMQFKVHRTRKSCLSEENEAMLNLDASVTPSAVTTSEKNKETYRSSSLEASSEANEFRSNLKAKYPTFTKSLKKSHVSGCFVMGLPPTFCRTHLPSVNTWIQLETENDKEYKVKYLAQRTALSGGLTAFSLACNLTEGDVLLFQLVNSTKFKVKKIRSGMSDVNGERVIPSACARNDGTNSDVATLEQYKETHQSSSYEEVSGGDTHVIISSEDEDENIQKAETTKKDTLGVSSADVKHPIIDDQNDFTNFDNFITLLDDLLKEDNNLSDHIKRSYHQLCCSQKSLLHTSLLEDINPSMATGCIIETVDIANVMKSCELTTFDASFSTWNRKLKILELTGMNVKFLSAHLLRLQRAASSSAATTQKYNDLCSKHTDRENRIKCLQHVMNDLRRLSEEDADEIEKLKAEIKEHETRFQVEQVSSPW